jgi:glycosyltransferase involved in cell wall biosynthesis
LEEYKGILQFLDAARILSRPDGLSIKMIVAGTGSLSAKLKQYECLPNLEIRDRVIEDDETIYLFSQAGLVVLLYSEGSQSAVTTIAYLFQKPVLVTRVGALPEYVQDGITGRVIDSNDPTLLAQTIHDMIRDKGALAQMGVAGRNYLSELEQQFHCKLLDTYTKITQGEARWEHL